MHRLLSSPRGILRVVFLLPLAITGAAPAAEPAAADEAWAAAVERHSPTSPTVPRAEPLKLRVFSLATGYQHSVTPSVDQVLQIIGRTSGMFHADITRDIEDLTADRLRHLDVLVLNNTCSVSPRRNLFLDVLETDARYAQLSAEERSARAAELEKSLLDFVRGGKGLVAIHGAPVLLNSSPAFTDMIGGAFDYHPPCQELTLRTVDPDHPLVAAFRGKEPFVHTDEPYCFKGPYAKRDFRPLLTIDTASVKDPKGAFGGDVRYAAWIRSYGNGRVFYCSPSHDRGSYESPVLLQFLLDGIQYAAGDLRCDDSPPANQAAAAGQSSG